MIRVTLCGQPRSRVTPVASRAAHFNFYISASDFILSHKIIIGISTSMWLLDHCIIDPVNDDVGDRAPCA